MARRQPTLLSRRNLCSKSGQPLSGRVTRDVEAALDFDASGTQAGCSRRALRGLWRLCCGGRVALGFKRVNRGLAEELVIKVDAEIAMRPHVYVFGAGHVGDALAYALSLTPVRVILVDTREAELMAVDAPGVETCLAAMPEQVVRSAPPASAFIVLTHDHALDFLIVAEALQRGDAVYVGMIGSKTKKATFKNWLKNEFGSADLFEKLVCPVGGAVVKDKRPEVIAALAAAEVLTTVLVSNKVLQMV